jgi:hypothetical protein
MSNLPTQKTICIIPARGGSKGLIRKNLREVGGHPLVSWPIAAARACPLIDRVVLSTDDDEIAEAGRSYGAEIPFIRPDSISRDLTTTEETLRYSLLEAERIFGEEYDIAVFLTATDFFRLPNWVEDVVAALISGGSPNEWSRLCSWMSEYSNRQIRKPVYREDTGLACASRASLWRAGRRIGDRVKIIESDYAQCGLDIHDEFDLFLVEQSLAWLQQYRPTQLPPIPHRVDEKEKS